MRGYHSLKLRPFYVSGTLLEIANHESTRPKLREMGTANGAETIGSTGRHLHHSPPQLSFPTSQFGIQPSRCEQSSRLYVLLSSRDTTCKVVCSATYSWQSPFQFPLEPSLTKPPHQSLPISRGLRSMDLRAVLGGGGQRDGQCFIDRAEERRTTSGCAVR